MSKSVETVGRTIEDAIEKALIELNADRDDVSVEVLEKPKSGFLGIGSTLARVMVSKNEAGPAEIARDFLEGLLSRMNSEAAIEIDFPEADLMDIRFTGDKLGLLIGRRGETLNAIQHLTSLVVNKKSETHFKVRVDTENYRAKREETLDSLAKKTASKAIKFRRSFSLEPMNAYERHVIHLALQETADIKTFSTGAEPNRKVVIAYAPGGVIPPSSGTGDYGNRRRPNQGGRDGRGGYGRYQERPRRRDDDNNR